MIDFFVNLDDRQLSFKKEKNSKRVIPICSCCKKIHVGKKSWKQLKNDLGKDLNAVFSHGLCPNCFEEQRLEFTKFKSRKSLYQLQKVANCS